MRRGLYRLANPSDYLYNEDLGLWELSFDTRPIAGTRCADPVDGSILYNEKRKRFVETSMKVQQELNTHPLHSFDFNDVLEWAVSDDANEKQCWFVNQLIQARNKEQYTAIALEFMKDKQSPVPAYMEIAVYFCGFEQRSSAGTDLVKEIEQKAGVQVQAVAAVK